jgi:hypothetical protein
MFLALVWFGKEKLTEWNTINTEITGIRSTGTPMPLPEPSLTKEKPPAPPSENPPVQLSRGVAEDFAKLSLDQKLKLALAGDREAQTALGLAYENGTQTKVDKLEAAKWFRMAADQGSIDPQFRLARIVSEDLPGLKKNPELAAKLYESAARQGHPEAQNWLGYSYQHGIGIAQSNASAVEWYRKAANSGLATAQNNLGLLYLSGTGVSRDYAKAFTLFEQAAKQGDSWALNNLGGLYEMGWGVPQDRERALESYQQAFAKGNRDAGRNLKRLSANRDSGPSAGRTQDEGKPVDAETKPPIVESKTRVDEAKETAGEPATFATGKAKSVTTDTVLSAPPLPRDAKMKPRVVESKMKVDEAKETAGEPATSATGKAKSVTTDTVLSTPPPPRDAKMKPPIVESKTKGDDAKEIVGEPATSATDKAKSVTIGTSAPPLLRSKPKSLIRKSLAPRLSKRAKDKKEAEVASPEESKRISLGIRSKGKTEIKRKDRNSSCRPRAFRSYAAGRMRPCDYW